MWQFKGLLSLQKNSKECALKSIVGSSTEIYEGKLCRKFEQSFSFHSDGATNRILPTAAPANFNFKSECCSLKPILNILRGGKLPSCCNYAILKVCSIRNIPQRMLYLECGKYCNSQMLLHPKWSFNNASSTHPKAIAILFFTCHETLSSVSDTASTRTDFGGPEGTDGGQKVKNYISGCLC